MCISLSEQWFLCASDYSRSTAWPLLQARWPSPGSSFPESSIIKTPSRDLTYAVMITERKGTRLLSVLFNLRLGTLAEIG